MTTVQRQPTGELVKRAAQQISDLMRAELRLAVAEMKGKGKRAGVGAGLLSGAGVLALFGVAALLTAVIAALALVLPVWLAALIVAVVLFIVAAVLGVTGRQSVGRATPPLPRQAMENTRLDVAEIKARAHR
ncbi:phage holin family protein [Spongiactinospora sp. TRM90649]|uniref:phage holin family protein n=1 Tax=Spongiactinospora sp. TRM90649 TaxID=3031114 RepID=UPI0023F8C63D|nr:phage holin family protein [Spongiactinospora sp. TRM90649]MDF5752766.1 phage holin family protein [Spongiactinospora sp. TRM90649]